MKHTNSRFQGHLLTWKDSIPTRKQRNLVGSKHFWEMMNGNGWCPAPCRINSRLFETEIKILLWHRKVYIKYLNETRKRKYQNDFFLIYITIFTVSAEVSKNHARNSCQFCKSLTSNFPLFPRKCCGQQLLSCHIFSRI